METVLQTVHAQNHQYLLASVVVGDTWHLMTLRGMDLFKCSYGESDKESLLQQTREHRSWQTFASQFMAGVKGGELHIPNFSDGPLNASQIVFNANADLKVFPGTGKVLTFELFRVLDTDEYKQSMSDLAFAIADGLQQAGVAGTPLRSLGRQESNLASELEAMRQERDHWKKVASSMPASTTSLNTASAPSGKGDRKRIQERSLLNPRAKM
ncbi:hypothetical protein HDU97_010074 [Phlyctochytrium planicorne]|nr:hypothetical protein HDU97_010074 [Phlyctochytrium planicorne]